ncbi:hypothetical protein FA15DRAFT_710023 [Coprinopsis marcescibilis]|uniref:HMG box domain-containing protein n=1 Tax=Coprinopsis marcescibilis TaxID=230819 RepID=A0A5C3KF14_COPMA|nr:hypothetical protein FA15DRAFT_710023 [Coprinopsis marcescibilis]
MSAISNIKQFRASGRLVKRIAVAYDGDGWQVPLEVHEAYKEDCPPQTAIQAPPVQTTISRRLNGANRGSSLNGSLSSSSDREAAISSVGRSLFSSGAQPISVPTAPTSASSASTFLEMPSTRHHRWTSSRKASHARRRGPNHIPRPRNAFIIFRSHLNSHYPPENRKTTDGSKINQSDVSKDAGKVWHSMSAEEKQPFFDKADREKREHSLLYPNYSYAPNKRGQARQSARKGLSGATDLDDSDSDSESSFHPPAVAVRVTHAARALRPRKTRCAEPTSKFSQSPTPSLCDSTSDNSSSSDFPANDEDEMIAPMKDTATIAIVPSAFDAMRGFERPDDTFIDMCARPPTVVPELNRVFGVTAYVDPAASDYQLPMLETLFDDDLSNVYSSFGQGAPITQALLEDLAHEWVESEEAGIEYNIELNIFDPDYQQIWAECMVSSPGMSFEFP